MHSVLVRQIKRFVIDEQNLEESLKQLLQAVSDTYTHNDEDKILVERSLDLTSKELTELNTKLKAEAQIAVESNESLKVRTEELERMNQLMIGREVKMAELKDQIDSLKKLLEEHQKTHQPDSQTT